MLLGVDVGGTFTDAVLVAEGRGLYTAKVPTTPSAQSEGVLEAIRLVLRDAGARPDQVTRFAHGMTVATNALLEGNTARTALLTTAGFEDVIELGRQNRPHLYRLCESAPRPLVAEELRFGVRERVTPEGVLEVLAARPRARAGAGAGGRRPGGGGGLPAALLRRPRTRAAALRTGPGAARRRSAVALQ